MSQPIGPSCETLPVAFFYRGSRIVVERQRYLIGEAYASPTFPGYKRAAFILHKFVWWP